ncbi:MAG: NAD-dependent epimerase/dehydratase family protein [Vicinamibacteria bacterium]|nr:NAD-dependent epimerase/dehydratase family protein [Vicinamibacteria bacterium]
MKVALTGVSGYTGGRLLETLIARKHDVTALVRPASMTPSLRNSGARIVEGDLASETAIDQLVSEAQAVVHVAAVYRTAGHPDSYYQDVNVGGTNRLLEAAARKGVMRFVHTSTVGVHGDVRQVPADESSPIVPSDVYQATKAEAEALALEFHHRRGLPVAVVRPAAIYGPGETRLLKLFRAIARGRYAIVGSGRPYYHPVYIDDLIQGFLLALEHPRAIGETFIIAGPRYVSQSELAAIIARSTGGRVLPFRIPALPIRMIGAVCEAVCVPLRIEPPLHRRRVDFWINNRAFSIEKARQILGYSPQIDVEEGIARTAAWYRNAGWL